jgi:hypothetical protein
MYMYIHMVLLYTYMYIHTDMYIHTSIYIYIIYIDIIYI